MVKNLKLNFETKQFCILQFCIFGDLRIWIYNIVIKYNIINLDAKSTKETYMKKSRKEKKIAHFISVGDNVAEGKTRRNSSTEYIIKKIVSFWYSLTAIYFHET